jgi:hypothetical protein
VAGIAVCFATITGRPSRIGDAMVDLLGIVLAAEKPPHIEGRDIVLSMLVVGLIFLGVIIVGELTKHLGHRRRRG